MGRLRQDFMPGVAVLRPYKPAEAGY
jgi:hypothetical protein